MKNEVRWVCEVCGHIHVGPRPPDVCPVCGVGPDLFRRLADQDDGTARSDALHAARLEAIEAREAGVSGDPLPIVVVGGGIAGVTAAKAARTQDSSRPVVLVQAEPELPYYRRDLTRFLNGDVTPEDLILHDAGWYVSLGIERVVGEVVGIDRERARVTLAEGRTLAYHRLILANGAHPFVPPLPGVVRRGVWTIRRRADAEALLAALTPDARVICLGGGLLGLEIAGALAGRAARVTVLEGAPWLLPRQLPRRAGERLKQHLETLGIQVVCSVHAEEIQGDESVRTVVTDRGPYPCDHLVIATGVRSNSRIAREAGLEVGLGVRVDDRMVTSDPRILAAGDVAEHDGVVRGLWVTALRQGAVAGANAAGGARTFAGSPPPSQLKVLGIPMFSIGAIEEDDPAVVSYTWEEDDRYYYLATRDGRVTGGALLGDIRLAGPIRKAVEAGAMLAESESILRGFPGLDPRGRPTANPRRTKMKSLKGTQTEKNLLAAFAGESQARNRYTYAAGVARKEGYRQIEAIFLETAENEKEHAKRFFKFLEGGMVEITAAYPAGTIGTTAENLKAAADGELEEWSDLYPAFAETARNEGFPEVAAAFTMIARAEKEHEARYRKLLENLEKDRVFKRETPVRWKCRNCGYVHEGPEAPDTCPACLHPREFFEIKETNY